MCGSVPRVLDCALRRLLALLAHVRITRRTSQADLVRVEGGEDGVHLVLGDALGKGFKQLDSDSLSFPRQLGLLTAQQVVQRIGLTLPG